MTIASIIFIGMCSILLFILVVVGIDYITPFTETAAKIAYRKTYKSVKKQIIIVQCRIDFECSLGNLYLEIDCDKSPSLTKPVILQWLRNEGYDVAHFSDHRESIIRISWS